MKRERLLDRLQSAEEPFDILIIGGGATGLGAAVDAAARGHRVALCEQADFAKGTSSRSTKLVHGGVRYLRQGNLSLVLTALRERGRLALNAPHLVRNQAFVIPNYAWWEQPFYGVGLKLYDRLAGRLGLGPSRWLDREETRRWLPTIEPEQLRGGVLYHDGQFDDARLAVNLAQTAVEQGAVVINYCRCAGFIKEGGRIVGADVRDEESGQEFAVRARVTINATGVFVDELRRRDESGAAALVTVSQGTHLVLPRRFLPGEAALMAPRTADGRVLFAVPWHDRVVVGTTDTPVDAASLEPRALAEEKAFLMNHACRYLTEDPVEGDVLSVFAGLRPLVKSGEGKGGTAALSRDHTIAVSQSGLVTITGGKWTTYRQMAVDVIDRAESVGGLESKRAVTETLKIHGWVLAGESGAKEDGAFHRQLYGADAPGVAAAISESPEGSERLHAALPYRLGEVAWHARHEMARTVEDVLARRTRALLLDARASMVAAPAVARVLAKELGRTERWQQEQVDTYRALAKGYLFNERSVTS